MDGRLSDEIVHLIHELPIALGWQLADLIRQHDAAGSTHLEAAVRHAFPQPAVQERIERFLKGWYVERERWTGASVALAIETACAVEERRRSEEKLEVVWTGPRTSAIPVRRTDQVLLELINCAQHDLHIVSFAVYRAQAIKHAIAQAGHRGVSVSLYVETWDAGEHRPRTNAVSMLGQSVLDVARIFLWPVEQRFESEGGQVGSLHAKLAVADSQILLVSSANLTDHAMTLNMEMGLLVRGGDTPKAVTSMLSRLIDDGTFVQA